MAKYGLDLDLTAANAQLTSRGFKNCPDLEMRTDFFLLALWLLVGANPAHEAKCLSDSKTVMSTPISAIIRAADSWEMPGKVFGDGRKCCGEIARDALLVRGSNGSHNVLFVDIHAAADAVYDFQFVSLQSKSRTLQYGKFVKQQQ